MPAATKLSVAPRRKSTSSMRLVPPVCVIRVPARSHGCNSRKEDRRVVNEWSLNARPTSFTYAFVPIESRNPSAMELKSPMTMSGEGGLLPVVFFVASSLRKWKHASFSCKEVLSVTTW